MTEYATTPSAIEEWHAQRNRTQDWVQSSLSPEHCSPPSRTPSSGSEYARRSLWDGGGWEPQSDCESSTSIPPTMMLQYSDHRQVLVTPEQSETSGWKGKGRSRERTRDEEGTERAHSHHRQPGANSQLLTPIEPMRDHSHHSVAYSRTSSAQLAHAAAAPLPESHSSSSGGTRSAGSRSMDVNPASTKPRSISKKSRSNSTSHSPTSPVPPASPARNSHSRARYSRSPSPSHHQDQASSGSYMQSQAAAQPRPPAHTHSLSASHSLSTGPEPIVIHPPAPSASQSHSTQSQSSTVYPHSYYAPSHYSQRTLQAAAHVPLPPPSTTSASLSYYSQGQVQILPTQAPSHHSILQTPFSHHAQMQNIHASQAPPSTSPRSYSASDQRQTVGMPLYAPAQLFHSQSHPPSAYAQSHVGHASTMSYGSQAGLGGGYVVVNQVDAPEPQPQTQGSAGGKSVDSQRRRERGSVFNVFGGSRHSRSRSLPQAEQTDAPQAPQPPVPSISASHHSHQSNHSNPYPSPLSPTSNYPPIPTSNANAHHNPALGPHPPSIVYAPARHGHATHYSPPRIMYMPGTSPRRHAREHSPTGSVRRVATVASPGSGSVAKEGSREGKSGEGRRPVIKQTTGEGALDGYANGHDHGHNQVNVYAAASPGSPTPSDANGNMAGVGTMRSRGHTRSRSRAKGITFSTSAPLPVAPPAGPMAPPVSISPSKRDAGVTPYPTPPGSANSHYAAAASLVCGPASASTHSDRISPVSNTGAGGLVPIFDDMHLVTDVTTIPAQAPVPVPSSSGRGRPRSREKNSRGSTKIKEMHSERREQRSHSVDSEVSHSSASTYYVIPTPGQKVRIIRTDGRNATATTSVSRHPSGSCASHAGGWLKKALRPRFLHVNTGSSKPAPAVDHVNSGGSASVSSKRSGRKLVRRNSTSSAALLSRQPSVNAP